MNGRRTHAPLLIAGALLLIATGEEPASTPLRSMNWLAPAVPIRSLALAPAECRMAVKDKARAQSIAIGRAAFRTPALLGGTAARVGLSCAECHRNGRTNPDFLFPGLSGAPGTADVTSAITSSHRDDRQFNPKPIPDLAAPTTKRIVSRDPRSRALEIFIHSAITEEFDGAEPPRRVLAGLSAYVRAISPDACPAHGTTTVLLHRHVADLKEALGAALFAWHEGDLPTARLMIASARTSLALIDERYAPLPKERASIRAADAGLDAIQTALDRKAPDVPVRIAAWRADMARWLPPLSRAEHRSLFNPALLFRAARPATLTASRTP